MRTYRYIIFDVDDTLLDYGCAYRTAQKRIAEKMGFPYSEEYIVLDDACGWKAWKENRLDYTEESDIQENYHLYYYRYIKQHYVYLAGSLGKNWDTNTLAEWYMDSVACTKVMMEPDTLEIYASLAGHYKLVLATNALERMQRSRLCMFMPYTHEVFISETVGYIKPSECFFSHMLQTLNCCPQDCLMVGDSLTNDMAGARTAGLDVCWYNPKKKSLPVGVTVTYEINTIRELLNIL